MQEKRGSYNVCVWGGETSFMHSVHLNEKELLSFSYFTDKRATQQRSVPNVRDGFLNIVYWTRVLYFQSLESRRGVTPHLGGGDVATVHAFIYLSVTFPKNSFLNPHEPLTPPHRIHFKKRYFLLPNWLRTPGV